MIFTFKLNDDRSGIEHLKDGSAHLAVVPVEDVVNELDSKRLEPTRHILVGPSSWAGRPVREIVTTERIIDFNEEDDATFRYLKRYRLFSTARKERHLANNTDALASMIAAGCGYSVLSENFAQPLIKQGRLVELNPGRRIQLEFALAWYPRPEMPEYFSRLIRNIQ